MIEIKRQCRKLNYGFDKKHNRPYSKTIIPRSILKKIVLKFIGQPFDQVHQAISLMEDKRSFKGQLLRNSFRGLITPAIWKNNTVYLQVWKGLCPLESLTGEYFYIHPNKKTFNFHVNQKTKSIPNPPQPSQIVKVKDNLFFIKVNNLWFEVEYKQYIRLTAENTDFQKKLPVLTLNGVKFYPYSYRQLSRRRVEKNNLQ